MSLAISELSFRQSLADLAGQDAGDREAARAWREAARPEQLPPDSNWRVWYVRGGRGGGKTWTGGNALAELIQTSPPGEWAAIGPTYGDARDTLIESAESGLLTALGLPRTYHGWNRSMGDLRLPNGSVVYADGADDGALRIQGKNLRGAWCVAAGEPVLTASGWRSIEDVRSGDQVWTRRGWRPVIAAGLTKRNTPVVTLRTSDSHAIRLTSNHRVWTEESGWLPTDQLRPGMTVATFQCPARQPISSGPTSAGTDDRSAATTPTGPAACCTSPSGSTSTGADFPTDQSSITSTTTLRTTTRRTSPRWTARSIYASTAWLGALMLNLSGRGSATLSALHGRIGNHAPSSARIAAPSFTPLASEHGSARPIAESRSTVSTVEPSGHADVYDLTVQGAHEFVASGVLVHNCDEIGLWKRWETAWDESLRFAVRKAPAKIIATGTPKRRMPAIKLIRRLMADEKVAQTVLLTKDNAAHLHPEMLDDLLLLAGTSLGMQELEGAVLDDPGGGYFHAGDWRYWQYETTPDGRRWLRLHDEQSGRSEVFDLNDCDRFITIDLAASLKTSADWTVAGAWAITIEGHLVLLDRVRARVSEIDHAEFVAPLRARWLGRYDVVHVESTMQSSTLAYQLGQSGIPWAPLRADKGKLERALPYVKLVRQHRVWLPHDASWLSEWVDEHAEFPNDQVADDQVDVGAYGARVQIANWVRMETAEQELARMPVHDPAYVDLMAAPW